LRRHADGKEIAPSLAHCPALSIHQAGGVSDQTIDNVVAHLVKDDQRLMVAGAAGQRVGTSETEHLHSRAGPVGRRRHIGIVRAAKIVPFRQYRVAADPTEPKIVLLRVAGGFIEPGLVPTVV
jgi:hypothetical protein